MRQQLGLVFGNIRELAFKDVGDASVERASRLAQQRSIGCILYQGMLEQISRVRSDTLSEEQSRCNKTVDR